VSMPARSSISSRPNYPVERSPYAVGVATKHHTRTGVGGRLPTPWAERHALDADGQPDYEVVLVDGRRRHFSSANGSGGPDGQRRTHKGREFAEDATPGRAASTRSTSSTWWPRCLFSARGHWGEVVRSAGHRDSGLEQEPHGALARAPPGGRILDSESARSWWGAGRDDARFDLQFKLSLARSNVRRGGAKPRFSKHRRIPLPDSSTIAESDEVGREGLSSGT